MAAGSPAPPSDPRIGTLIGKYRLLKVLGQGGMGIVFEAEDTVLRRYVALKLLSDERLGSAGAMQRFIREARTTARLRHPNIIEIYNVGEHDGQFFMVMERLLPLSAGGLLARYGAIPWHSAAQLLTELEQVLKDVVRIGLPILHIHVSTEGAEEASLYLGDARTAGGPPARKTPLRLALLFLVLLFKTLAPPVIPQ